MNRHFVLFAVLGMPLWAGSLAAAPEPVHEALPLVGTGGHGHTYPGATVPFGFVQLSPDTRTEGWDACSGYHYSDSTILGFSHTHLSGTGAADLGDLLVLPLVGNIDQPHRSRFSHEKETAEPGYYRVFLEDSGVMAELTATAHAGMHRYTFPASRQAHLLIDLFHGLGNKPLDACLQAEKGNLLTGYRRTDGWAKGRTIYFAVECSPPFRDFSLDKSKEVRGHLDFHTKAGQQIVLKVGLSPTSVEEAKKNLETELGSKHFDAVRQEAQTAWNQSLSRIRIETANANVRQTFYSALYHTMSAPTLYNNADGAYRGTDGQTHSNANFQYYSTFSLWDTFRAEHPLMTLFQPGRVNDFVQTMLAFYQQSTNHALPMWPLASYETWGMIAYHSVPVIWDAYAKGFRGFDAELAYKAMRETAMSGRLRQNEYQKYGYVPWVKGQGAATSSTLEFTFDDWCLGKMAAALGKTQDTEFFLRRSLNYTNLWDPKTQFFRSKNPDGTFHEPFDPKEAADWSDSVSSDSYTEADAWQYRFAVMHDVPGMIGIYGGARPFVDMLDRLFNEDSEMRNWSTDVTGLVGQYAHGNEPCHHIAYLYALAGAPYKTAQRARQIMLTQYDNTPEGICGNDDCGQMSAWYVFSALGFYPANPGDQIYVLGSPMVSKATIDLDPKDDPGGTFTIIAHKELSEDMYIQSAKLNGAPLNRPWITHEEIVHGGTLELEMGILPNKTWGTGAK